jgi:NAD(P)H-dependent flavin oxidoreductase YrpB (nitropropane dioxygenase family)
MIGPATEKGHPRRIPVGKRQHAERQLAVRVDILIAQGYEAGGHTGALTPTMRMRCCATLRGHVAQLIDDPAQLATMVGTIQRQVVTRSRLDTRQFSM